MSHFNVTMASVTPDDVLEFKEAAEGFLCPLDANTYELSFLSFVMKDYDTKEVIFEIGQDSPLPDLDLDDENFDPDTLRRIRYDFSVDVLKKETISTTLVFSNGAKPLEGFRMIERHYFREVLIKSFDFDFGFVIPNTTNTWESVYTVPAMPEELLREIVANPYEVKSDSFYFSNNKLIMHNKAEYRYFDAAAPASASIPNPAAEKAKASSKEAEEDDGVGGKVAESPAGGKVAEEEDEEESKTGRSRRSFKVRARGSSKLDDSDDDD